MKIIILGTFLSASIYGQWITGFYAAQNGAMPVSTIAWNKYTHVIHFAAAPNGTGNGTVSLNYLTQAEINQLIAERPIGKKILVCIKDNDSNYNAFAQNTSPAMIATFVSNIVNLVNTNHYDGVDIDWEANVNTAQFEDLLRRLRSALPGRVISMDAGDWGGLNIVDAVSYSALDQINIMCYDMDNGANCNGQNCSWHNDALYQDGQTDKRTCDARVAVFTNAGVPHNKIGVGIPFYGRRRTGVSQPEVLGTFPSYTVFYRNLVTDATRWQSAYMQYDTSFKADYLSIPSLNEFISYNGTHSINDTVAWGRSQGFGGFMTFTMDYEYLSSQSGDARYPLSTALYNLVFGNTPTDTAPVISSGSPSGTLDGSVTSAALSVVTNENATCKYSTVVGTSYSAMPYTFSVTGGTTHSTTVFGLQTGTTYNYYVKCSDTAGTVDTTDYGISFSIAQTATVAPTPIKLTPASGSGSSQQFTLQISDVSGYGDIQQIDAVFNKAIGLPHSCLIEYWAPTRTIYLSSDDNASWTQAALGSSAVLQNSQCGVNAARSSVSEAGTALNLTLAMNFSSTYSGTNNIFVFAAGQSGLNSGWQDLGSWTVPVKVVQGPPTVTLTPANGVGSGVTFTISVTDGNGYATVQQTELVIGAVGGHSCWIEYWAHTNTLYLRSDDNTSWYSGTVGSSTTLENSQCAVDARSSTVSGSGNTFVLALPVTFSRTYTGVKPIYSFAADRSGSSSGWQTSGSWTVK
jgi:GH18 family chitinase